MLRHTHVYLLLEEGRDPTYIQKRLGHQSLNYVSRYTQPSESEEQRVVDAVELR